MLRGVTIALLVPVAAGITISGGTEKAVDFLINPDDGLNKVWRVASASDSYVDKALGYGSVIGVKGYLIAASLYLAAQTGMPVTGSTAAWAVGTDAAGNVVSLYVHGKLLDPGDDIAIGVSSVLPGAASNLASRMAALNLVGGGLAGRALTASLQIPQGGGWNFWMGVRQVEIVLTTGKAMTIDESAGFLLGSYATEALFKSGSLAIGKAAGTIWGSSGTLSSTLGKALQGGRAWVNGKVGGTLSQPVGNLAKEALGPHAVSRLNLAVKGAQAGKATADYGKRVPDSIRSLDCCRWSWLRGYQNLNKDSFSLFSSALDFGKGFS